MQWLHGAIRQRSPNSARKQKALLDALFAGTDVKAPKEAKPKDISAYDVFYAEQLPRYKDKVLPNGKPDLGAIRHAISELYKNVGPEDMEILKAKARELSSQPEGELVTEVGPPVGSSSNNVDNRSLARYILCVGFLRRMLTTDVSRGEATDQLMDNLQQWIDRWFEVTGVRIAMLVGGLDGGHHPMVDM